MVIRMGDNERVFVILLISCFFTYILYISTFVLIVNGLVM